MEASALFLWVKVDGSYLSFYIHESVVAYTDSSCSVQASVQ